MSAPNILVEVRGRVGLMTLNRPEALNALSLDLRDELAVAIDTLEIDAALAKDAVNRAFETPLAEGLRYERRLFQATFATEDRKEGMSAFIEKRKPHFQNR